MVAKQHQLLVMLFLAMFMPLEHATICNLLSLNISDCVSTHYCTVFIPRARVSVIECTFANSLAQNYVCHEFAIDSVSYSNKCNFANLSHSHMSYSMVYFSGREGEINDCTFYLNNPSKYLFGGSVGSNKVVNCYISHSSYLFLPGLSIPTSNIFVYSSSHSLKHLQVGSCQADLPIPQSNIKTQYNSRTKSKMFLFSSVFMIHL